MSETMSKEMQSAVNEVLTERFAREVWSHASPEAKKRFADAALAEMEKRVADHFGWQGDSYAKNVIDQTIQEIFPRFRETVENLVKKSALENVDFLARVCEENAQRLVSYRIEGLARTLTQAAEKAMTAALQEALRKGGS